MKKHTGSTIALILGFFSLAGGVANTDNLDVLIIVGPVIILAALSYRSAKKRKLGEVHNTAFRIGLEISALIIIVGAILLQKDLKTLFIIDAAPNIVIPIWLIIAADPIPIVIPLWAIIAYLVIAFKARRVEEEFKRKEASRQSPGHTLSNYLGMEFVWIPAGTFMMGSPQEENWRVDDERQHHVTLTQGYYMQTTAVTQGQWKAIMGSNPSRFSNCGDDCPVERVSWKKAQRFIRRLNQREGANKYRLPTEGEWEYAARAGTTTPFNTGNCLSTDQANYSYNPSMRDPSREERGKTVSVASFAPNAWGLYDMHGNVWEWVQDKYGDYPTGAVTDPVGPSSGSRRVLRGGSWTTPDAFCRSATRHSHYPIFWSGNRGFRLVFIPESVSLSSALCVL